MQSKYTRLWNFVVTDPKSTNPRDFGILLTPLLSLLRHGKELPWIRTECVIDTVQASSSRALQISKTKGLVCIGSCAFQDRGNSKLGAFGGLGQPSAGHKGLRTFGMYRPLELETFGLGVSAVLVQAAAYLAQAVVFLYKAGSSEQWMPWRREFLNLKAIDYDGLECPNNSPVGCAASVAGCSPAVSNVL